MQHRAPVCGGKTPAFVAKSGLVVYHDRAGSAPGKAVIQRECVGAWARVRGGGVHLVLVEYYDIVPRPSGAALEV